jgi:hypothetical protein
MSTVPNALHSYDVPVAMSMLKFVNTGAPDLQSAFACYWMAFNDIYSRRSRARGIQPTIRVDKAGAIKTRRTGSVDVPMVQAAKERDQLAAVLQDFDAELKEALITEDSVTFFADRTPLWNDAPLPHDSKGQVLNGVLNVGHTFSIAHPVWAPIDTATLTRCRQGQPTPNEVDAVVEQIVILLYTVRNNLFHGGKQFDDASDNDVLEHALPLLKKIVVAFIKD